VRARGWALALLALAALTLVRPALAWLPEEGGEPVQGEGDQTVTVLLRGVAGGHRVEAWLGQDSAMILQDMGGGMQAASFRTTPARSCRLTLFDVSGENRSELFDGLVILADQHREILAFQVEQRHGVSRALRIPLTPALQSELALDQRLPYLVAFGWGALCLVYLGFLAVLWRRSRAGPADRND